MPEASRIPPGQLVPERAGQRDEHARDEVRQDDIEPVLVARQAAFAGPDPADQPVPPSVGERRLLGDRIRVHAERRDGTQFHGRDGEDPRPAADVQDARPVQLAAIRHGFERREAQAGRRVEAGPERHPRIEREDDVIGQARGGGARSDG